MSSRFLSFVFVFALASFPQIAVGQPSELRVCADPANLPFSNIHRQGFENRIAELLARSTGARLDYVWQRMGRGFVREFLNTSRCDLVIGVPTNYRPLLTSSPYYRSSYVFVTRRDRNLRIASFDSPELRGLKIGVQALDEQYTPPGEALARRGLQDGIVGFNGTGEEAGSIIRAVAERRVDVAAVWGPLAGYFARQYGNTLSLTPVAVEADASGLPFSFEISLGVRKGNLALRNVVERFLREQQQQLNKILDSYGIPRSPLKDMQTRSAIAN